MLAGDEQAVKAAGGGGAEPPGAVQPATEAKKSGSAPAAGRSLLEGGYASLDALPLAFWDTAR